MQNQTSQLSGASAEDLVKISAKRAAAEAVQFHNAELRRHETKFGAFAIYAWAFFAFAASGIGGSTLYLNKQISSDPVITASTSQKVDTGKNVDPITTASTATSIPAETSSLGVTIGGFTDIDVIMEIYSLVQNNSALDLAEKEPLVRFKLEDKAYQAALIVGPFQDFQSIISFCSNAQLPCETTSYTGAPLFTQ